MKVTKTTGIGQFVQDESGLWHYEHGRAAGPVFDCVKDAIENRPDGPTWFWFNGTPAPIHPSDIDDHDALFRRWNEWREDYQRGRLLDRLTTYAQNA